LTSARNIADPVLFKVLIDDGILNRDFHALTVSGLCIFILFIFYAALSYYQFLTIENISRSINCDLSQKGFKKALELTVSYYEDTHSFQVIGNLNYDATCISSIVNNEFLFFLSGFFNVFAGIIGLIYINWRLSVLAFVFIPIKILLMNYYTKRKLKISKETLNLVERFSGWAGDVFTNIELVKLWNLYKKVSFEHLKYQKEIINNNKTNSIYSEIRKISTEIMDLVFQLLSYFFGALMIFNNQMSFGTLVSFFKYSSYVSSPIYFITQIKEHFGTIKPSLNRYIGFLELESEAGRGTSQFSVPNEIRFEHVSMKYKDKKVLDDVSFLLRKGESVAITGSNGSGKSTLVKLILRYYKPVAGEIFFDGAKIEDVDLFSYRDKVAFVPQSSSLFNKSLYSNLNLNDMYSQEQILEILDAWNMKSVFGAYIAETDINVGERGSKFSGGELQKLAAIRAILKDSSILLLDEPTSSFDKNSTEFFYKNLFSGLKYDYLIIISHQKEVLKYVDRVICLQEGKIISNKMTNI
jgi:ATP-binding cassette subfamily B protein